MLKEGEYGLCLRLDPHHGSASNSSNLDGSFPGSAADSGNLKSPLGSPIRSPKGVPDGIAALSPAPLNASLDTPATASPGTRAKIEVSSETSLLGVLRFRRFIFSFAAGFSDLLSFRF